MRENCFISRPEFVLAGEELMSREVIPFVDGANAGTLEDL